MPKNLDFEYDEYLKSNEAAIQAVSHFSNHLKDKKFMYGKVVIPSFYKPHFLSEKQEHLLKRVTSTLHQVINTACRLYFEVGHLQNVFRIPPEAHQLIEIDPGYSSSVIFSRFDALLEGESLKMVELNCDSPAGAAYTDQLEQVLFEEKPLQNFIEQYHLRCSDRMSYILNSLLEVYEEFGGFETPQIAIVDWRRTRAAFEFERLKEYFESKGYKTIVADPRDLKYKSGKLYHKNFRIDIIYRRVVFDELLMRLDEVKDMIKAYKERAVCIVNPLRSRLASSKALLSVLTNPEYDHYFTDNENEVKKEHLLWTRRLEDAADFYGHKTEYLIDFLKDEKETLILKPSLASGGTDVFIGEETRDDDWNAAIGKALKGDWVVQEFCNIPIMTVPKVVGGKIDFDYKKYNFNVIAIGGKCAGAFVRLSDESVINVARGGGMIPSIASENVSSFFGA